MKVSISVDDGGYSDLKVAELLEKHGFKGIFFIPALTTRIRGNDLKDLAKVHEIGGHTMTHPYDLKTLPYPQLQYEVMEGKKKLEYIIGKEIEAFCYPRGRFNQVVKEVVIDAGYKWARTARVLRTKMPVDPFETDTTIHILRTRKEYEGRDLLGLVDEMLVKASQEEDGMFHMWLHSSELDEHCLWSEFEEALKMIKPFVK
jgi:peptidoglycan/xylan/chitin deacetylase (PgdA/CDA1 family)